MNVEVQLKSKKYKILGWNIGNFRQI
jgi:hypothetical protein